LNERRLCLLLRLIGILTLDDAVQARTDDGDGGTDERLRRDLVTEGEDAEADDEDALTDVTDSVGHRSDLAEGLVRDLVVHMVVETDRSEGHQEFSLALDGDGLLNAGGERRAFKVDGERQAEHQSHDGDPVVEVERTHFAHELLAEDGARGEGDVGAHRRQETQPGEGEFRRRGDGDADDHREQGEVHRKRVHGTGDQVGTDGGEDRLERLHGVREGHGDGGERNVRQAVTERVQKRRQGQRLQKLFIGLFVLNQLAAPEETHNEQTHDQVHARDEPRVREVVVNRLVHDVKLHVQKVPRRKVKHRLELRELFLELAQRTAAPSKDAHATNNRQSPNSRVVARAFTIGTHSPTPHRTPSIHRRLVSSPRLVGARAREPMKT